jgi:hypothetical protein
MPLLVNEAFFFLKRSYYCKCKEKEFYADFKNVDIPE